MTTREEVYSALFELASTSTEWVTVGRRVRLFSDVTPPERPALFMRELDETYINGVIGNPPIRTWKAEFFIYVHTIGVDPPSSVINRYLDLMDQLLAPRPGFQQTLNGLVQIAYIDGEILKTPGDVDGDGIAVVPVSILVP